MDFRDLLLISFGRPGLDIVTVLVQKQRSLGLVSDQIFKQKIVCNQYMKFTFFHLCKKFGGWLLSDTVTCKVINGFDSSNTRKKFVFDSSLDYHRLLDRDEVVKVFFDDFNNSVHLSTNAFEKFVEILID